MGYKSGSEIRFCGYRWSEFMKAGKLIDLLGADFYTGVPDSLLAPFCDCLMKRYGTDPAHHIVAANEGNAAAIAAGYHLATGKIPVVYMQNSGEGNIVNPAASLLHEKVYAIPVLFVIGWRGEPGTQDEPQHTYQGAVTCRLLEDLGIEYAVVGPQTQEGQLHLVMQRFRQLFSEGICAALVVRRGVLEQEQQAGDQNAYQMEREEAIRRIAEAAGTDPVIVTTGKAGRELFEIRTANRQGHQTDFLTVGSMGHCSSIALGIAIHKPDTKIWCVDGDGAVLMHMGALAVAGAASPQNLVHIVINNGAHESVGGMVNAARDLELAAVAGTCGYRYAVCVERYEDLDAELERARTGAGLRMIEVKCAVGSRKDLGRPGVGARENKEAFMRYVKGL